MGTFLGHYRANEGYVQARSAASRADGSGLVTDALREKVMAFREQTPEGITLVAAYAPIATSNDQGGVLVVETDDPIRLGAINDHYAGYLDFSWQPVNAMGVTAAAASAAMDASTSGSPVMSTPSVN